MLTETIKLMINDNRGILAADESVPTISKRFQALNIPSTAETRFEYRKLLLSCTNLKQHIAAVILHEETLTQMGDYCAAQGMVPGIKVDQGLMDYNNHKITKGLDDLVARLPNYKSLGARFCKWRAVYEVVDSAPVAWSINAMQLAIYAKLCQDHGLVPIVEPEILLQGDYSLEQAISAHKIILQQTFTELVKHEVKLESIILKPSMVLPGKEHELQVDDLTIAQATVDTFLQTVPDLVPSINFLSGGQTPTQATSRLIAIRDYANSVNANFRFSFSFARALQEPAMKLFSENKADAAQLALLERANANTV